MAREGPYGSFFNGVFVGFFFFFFFFFFYISDGLFGLLIRGNKVLRDLV